MRDCTICGEGVSGDDIHFLYECTKLLDLRTKYISSCNRMSTNVHNLTLMLQTSEPDNIYNLAKFILCDLSCMVNDPTPSVLFMNLYKCNFTRIVVQLGNYYQVVIIDM